MKNRGFLGKVTIAIIAALILSYGVIILVPKSTALPTESISTRPIKSVISAAGSIHSQNEATLHFQTGGKLIYLPFKEGDTVTEGQTIAQLDTYTLQRQLSAALNTYRSTRDTFDQTQQNSQTGVLQGQQKYGLEVTNKAGLGGDSENNVINDMVKRIVDQNQANLDNSVINVELANYAIQLSTLTAPFSGVITHEDVTSPQLNITPLTAFTVQDPSTIVFRANVLATDIDFVSIGAKATIRLDGQEQRYVGNVISIAPQKTTVDGQDVYTVDIQNDVLANIAKFDQAGNVQIESNTDSSVTLVPSWMVLGHNQIWVVSQGKPTLKTIILGRNHGALVEVKSGLSSDDRLITKPQVIARKGYHIL